MLKTATLFFVSALVTSFALFSANRKANHLNPFDLVRVGKSVESLRSLGVPLSKSQSQNHYLLENGSTLVVNILNNRVSGAWIELKKPLSINDERFSHLRFVKLNMEDTSRPSWFYAGSPSEGKIFKVSHKGMIESISWVKPFSESKNTKNLQALLFEFNQQNSRTL